METNRQYIPNRKNAQVVTDLNPYYFYDGDVIPSDELQQALYKKGYVGYIMLNVSCLLDKKQSVDLYFGDRKVLTLTSDKFSKLEEFEKQTCHEYPYYRTRKNKRLSLYAICPECGNPIQKKDIARI